MIKKLPIKKGNEEYSNLADLINERHEELSNLFKPYVDVTDDYGRLICRFTLLLGKIKPSSIQDRVVRDLMADAFDSLAPDVNIKFFGSTPSISHTLPFLILNSL